MIPLSPHLPTATQCVGCGACVEVCPSGALTETADAWGFPTPKFDAARCQACGACDKVCPVLASEEPPASEEKKRLTGACKSDAVLFGSSAGGLFSALAMRTLRAGGAVLGAAFDNAFSLVETWAETPEALTALRGFKYPQALANGCFRSIRERLEAGQPVFACLPPCRAEALLRFLGGPSEHLLLADVACSGVASPFAFQTYVKGVASRETGAVVSFRATLRELMRPTDACNRTLPAYAWHDSAITFAHGQGRFCQASEEPFVRLTLGTDLFLRPACRDCRWANRSVADLTLSRATNDRWGKGGVIAHTPKGLAALRALTGVTLEDVTGETSLRQPPPPRRQVPETMRSAVLEALKSGAPWNEATNAAEALLPPMMPKETFSRRLRSLRRCAPFWRPLQFALACRLNGWRRLLSPGHGGIFLPAGSRAVIRCKNPKGLRVERGVFVFGLDHVKGDGLTSRIAVDRLSSILIRGHGRVKSGSEFIVYAGGRLEIGVGLDAESHLEIRCASRTVIGNYVGMGRHVTIVDNNGQHPTTNAFSNTPRVTEICDHAWLCDGCTIMPGVRVGIGAVVSAGAVVTHSVPPYAVVAGNPAVVVGKNLLWGG